MAPFNPEVPHKEAPNYLGYSHPISEFHGDKSSGIALAGVGNLIEGGVKTLDRYVQANIEEAVNAGVDTLSGINIAGLEASTNTPTASLTETNPELPVGINTASSRAGFLKLAADSGKISLTDYYGKLYAMQKQLRAAYPGYRDFIDAQVSQATGVNPANAYRRALLSEYNESAGSATAERNKVLGLLFKYAPDKVEDFLAGKFDNNRAILEASIRASQDADLKRRKALREDSKGTREYKSDLASDDVKKIASDGLRNLISDIELESGLAHPMSVKALQEGLDNGTIPPLSDDQAEKLAAEFGRKAALKAYDITQRIANSNLLKDVDTNVAKQIVDNTYGAGVKQMMDLFVSKDIGMVYRQAKHIASVANGAASDLLDDPDVGALLAYNAGMLKAMGSSGDAAFKMVGSLMRSNIPIEKRSDASFERFINRYNENKFKLITQATAKKDSGGSYSLESSPTPITFKKIIQDDLSRGVKQSEFVSDYIDLAKRISDPTLPPQTKMNLIRASFSPENVSMLTLVKQPIEAFQRLTSIDIAQSVRKLSEEQGRPDLWLNYKNWVETEFGSQIFSKEIRRLNDLQDDARLNIKYSNENGIHRFTAESAQPRPDLTHIRTVQEANAILGRINLGLPSIANMSQIEGSDVDVYLFSLMRRAGFEPGTSISGIPQKIMDALALARARPSVSERITGKTQERVTPNQPVVNRIAK